MECSLLPLVVDRRLSLGLFRVLSESCSSPDPFSPHTVSWGEGGGPRVSGRFLYRVAVCVAACDIVYSDGARE
jgi:hypothetical protein